MMGFFDLETRAHIIALLRFNIVIRFILYPFMNIKRIYRLKRYRNSDDSKKILSIKDSCKGKRCFIIGNGPSLTVDDLDKLVEEDTFGVNRIFQIYDKTKWRPTYYCCIDKDAWIYCKKFFEDNAVESKLFLENELDIDKRNSNDIFKFYGVPYFTLDRKRVKQLSQVKFAENLEKGIYVAYTVSVIAIQLAIYMGYSEIYLLGTDCNYSNDPQKNYPEELQMKYIAPDYKYSNNKQMESYMMAKEYAAANGVKIINATRGGSLEVLERVNLEDILRQSK